MHLKFIEALAGESQQLSISKDQLAGYTQTVNSYKVVNVTLYDRPLYLVNTPGFSDSKISELEIMEMVRKWMNDNGFKYLHGILYLTPISETRLPGSRRRTIEMLKQFLEPNGDLRSVTFVTTMWDTLHNERTQMRAESNFAQLRDQDFFGRNQVFITRFMNTRNSALEILDDVHYDSADAFSKPISSAFPNLYHDLHERIEGALQAKKMIAAELDQPEAQSNADLRAILEQNQRENHETPSKFIAQFVNFGPPPPGFRHAAQLLRKSIAANMIPPDSTYKRLYWQWKHEASIPANHDSDTSTRVLVIKGLAQLLFRIPKRPAAEASVHGK